MHRGYVKAWRAMKDHHLWKHGTPHQRSIIMALLWLASYRENKWVWKGQEFVVKPGQMITSLESIRDAAGDGTTVQSVRGALAKFSKCGFITDEATKQGRLITITNWELYQSDNIPNNIDDNKATTKQQQSNNKATTPINNVKECKKVRNEDIKSCECVVPTPPLPSVLNPTNEVVKPKRKAPEPTGDHNQTIRYFTDAYQAKSGIKYPFQSGKDASAMKNLLAHYSPEMVRRMIDIYLADNSPFFAKTGKTIAMLWSHAATFALKAGKPNCGRDEIDYDEAGRFKSKGELNA